MKVATKLSVMLLVVPVIFLTGCKPWEWLKGHLGKKAGTEVVAEGNEVLVTLRGKPLMTAQKFEQEFNKFLEENPQYKAALSFMPDLKKDVFMGMVNQELVDFWAKDSKADQKTEYAQDMERMMTNAKHIVNSKYFGEMHPVKLTDEELKEFYDKQKDVLPDLLISRGGVKTKAISFDKQEAAKNFLEKMKEFKDLDKTAKALNLAKNVRDFKQVHQFTMGIDTALRDKVLELKKFPAHDMVKAADGKAFWVFVATAKEDAQYQPFEKIKAGLEQYVTHEKRKKVIGEALEQLKKDYEVVISDEYFKAKPAEQAQPEVQQTEAKTADAEPAAQAEQAPVAQAA
ncbi:hypothetical protein CVU75_02485 [Candidatus Dependentiae bacterium HGW-Dependentiae-1]|nr:MAG: hypothetical protein CVU75_02485 [Candidatus Dependentiae bacterium HGW-Dependentiae-1]